MLFESILNVFMLLELVLNSQALQCEIGSSLFNTATINSYDFEPKDCNDTCYSINLTRVVGTNPHVSTNIQYNAKNCTTKKKCRNESSLCNQTLERFNNENKGKNITYLESYCNVTCTDPRNFSSKDPMMPGANSKASSYLKSNARIVLMITFGFHHLIANIF